MFAACAIAAGAPVWAQDVAEAARQAQARKHHQTKHKKHVYTEEDLKRAQILTREDQELLAAKKRDAVVPGAEVSTTLDAQTLEHLPLGDVARMYRAMKELNHSQTGELAEYHLPVANTELASAKLEFVVLKPNAAEPMPHNAPVAPMFPNAETKHAEVEFPIGAGKTKCASTDDRTAPAAKTPSGAGTVAANVKICCFKTEHACTGSAMKRPSPPCFQRWNRFQPRN